MWCRRKESRYCQASEVSGREEEEGKDIIIK